MTKLFADIVGQEGAVKILQSQLSTGNLSHAYLILGDDGAGKEFLAREFAKYLLCFDLSKKECESCLKMEKGVHPDFIFVDGRNGIKIDEVRAAVERINLSPGMSKKKVLLITNAENLGIEAANALLKTFEEPPADTVIILTAITEKSVPETISSRGQKIKLKPISAESITKVLTSLFPGKNIDQAVALSFGSLGEAKKIAADEEYAKKREAMLTSAKSLFFAWFAYGKV